MTIIKCYCRLNFGLIDLSDNPYRIDGSHGLYTNLVLGQVCIKFSEKYEVQIQDTYPTRYYKVIKKCIALIDDVSAEHIHISLENYIGTHIGLGSGTQLAMSIVEAFNREFELNLSIDEKACLAGSGGSSNIGVYCFEHGGYILDAGRLYPKEKDTIGPSENYCFQKLSPLLARLELPKWYVCIVTSNMNFVVEGELETDLFQKYTPIPENEVNSLCMWILKGIMPAIITKDFSSFCYSIEQVMKIGFRSREILTYDLVVKEKMKALKDAGLNGVGMTSFGPTVFGFAADEQSANLAYNVLKKHFILDHVYLTTVRNKGADFYETVKF